MKRKFNLFILLSIAGYQLGLGGHHLKKDYTFLSPNQQVFKIKGRVLDDQPPFNPLTGVSIQVKGTSVGTISNAEGYFSVDAPANSVLTFSILNYSTFEYKVTKNEEKLSISLTPQASSLDEVLVVGYGTVLKSDLTGSVSSVDMKEIAKAPVAAFTEALAGRIAGVQVSSPEGQPGQLPEIVIRGPGSMTQSNAPLYVIDGFPMEDPDETILNTDDIASINILKDASATAIFGSRAANGVIVIETKKGKSGPPAVTLNSFTGYQPLNKQVDVMNPYEFVKYQTERGITSYTNGKDLEEYRNEKGINWQDEIFRDAFTQNHNFAIRGGSHQTKYSLSGSINQKDGVIVNSGFKRYQGRLSIDQDVTSKIKVGITANYSNHASSGQLVSAGDGELSTYSYLFVRTWGYRPVVAPVDTSDNGELLDLLEMERDIHSPNAVINPFVSSTNISRLNKTSALTTSAYLDYAILKNLRLRLQGSVDTRQVRNEYFAGSKAINLASTRGVYGYFNDANTDVVSSENTLVWDNVFNNSHKLNVMTGASIQGRKQSIFGYNAQNLPNDELGVYGLDDGVPYSTQASGAESTLASFFGRINYDYKSKYLLTATFRGDGSSKFSPGNRWGYFPSVAAAWNMKNEDFFKNISILSQSKIRISYGHTGNNRVGEYSYLPEIDFPISASYSFQNETPRLGAIPTSMANAALRWETTKQFDIGYDLGLWGNRVEIVMDLYRKTTTDMLLNAMLPRSIGYNQAFKNVGSMRNDGLELSLTTRNIQRSSFRWNTSFNISFNKNVLLELTDGETDLFIQPRFQTQFNMPLYRAQIGKPLGMFYAHIFDGVYQYEDFDIPVPGMYVLKDNVPSNGTAVRANIQPGDIKYKDINGDGIVDVHDRVNIGRGQPIHIGGFLNDFSYKNFDLSVLFQWSYGNHIYNANRLMMEGNASNLNHFNQFASYIDRWSDTNQDSRNFRVGGAGPNTFSSRVLEDGSYLRLKTLSFGYSFSRDKIKNLGLKLLRINVSAQNLLTWSSYSGLDPEVSTLRSILTPGFDFSAYPPAKTIVLGINVSL